MWVRGPAGKYIIIGVAVMACGLSPLAQSKHSGAGEVGSNTVSLRQAWKTNVGKGHSSVVVRGNRLYTLGSITIDEDNTIDVVTCLDVGTGAVVWKYEYSCPEIHFAGPRATPVVDNNRIYSLSWDGRLHCLDAGNGKLIWRRNLIDDNLAEPGHWGMAGSPVVDEGRLIITAGESGLAFDKHSGEVMWRSEATETGLPSPLLMESGGKDFALIPGATVSHGVKVQTGAVEWSIARDKDFHLGPTMIRDMLFMPGSSSSVLYDLSGATPKPFREISLRLSGYQSYAIVDHYLYGFAGADVFCIDVMTGKQMWQQRVGHHGALSECKGKLIILRGNGVLNIAEAIPSRYSELANINVIEIGENHVPQPDQHHCWTAPVLTNGRVFVRSNHGELVCVELRS
jgi:outer membrane protein assembly factor BamB